MPVILFDHSSMSGSVDNSRYASYALDAEWTTDLKTSTAEWILKKLTQMQGESEENAVYVEYINTLIEHRKTMAEIAVDLKDFFGDNESRSAAARECRFMHFPAFVALLNHRSYLSCYMCSHSDCLHMILGDSYQNPLIRKRIPPTSPRIRHHKQWHQRLVMHPLLRSEQSI